MNENKLIKDLIADHKPFKTVEALPQFLLKWSGYTFIVFILAYIFLPARHDIMTEMETVRFHVENILWFVASLASGITFYFSAFPQKTKSTVWIPATFSMALLFILVLSGIHTEALSEEFIMEMDLWRGRCGFIILSISMIHAGFLGSWAKKAAPRNSGMTGLWAALSASAMGCLFMQVVCTHQNTLHLMIWHFLPLAVICFVGQWLGKTFLRW